MSEVSVGNDLSPHAETFAQAARGSRHLPKRLRDSRKRQKVSRETCGAPANTKKFFEALAGLPQTPKSFSRHLRDSRKRQKVSRETCGAPANTKKFSEALAGLPQTPKSFSRHLRGSRKHQKVFRETCGAPANAKKFFVRLAGLPQTPKSFSWDLRDSRKRFFTDGEMDWRAPGKDGRRPCALAGLPQTPLSRQNVSPKATGIFFDPRGRPVIRKITAQPSDRSFINNK